MTEPLTRESERGKKEEKDKDLLKRKKMEERCLLEGYLPVGELWGTMGAINQW